MKYLEIVKILGIATKDNGEKMLLRDYYDRIKEHVKQDHSDEQIEHVFCLMMAGYIMRYVDKQVDYSKQNADYYIDLLREHGHIKETSA